MLYIGFSDLNEAARHRGNHGGWIFVADTGEVIWFSPIFTPTSVITHPATRGMNGRLI